MSSSHELNLELSPRSPGECDQSENNSFLVLLDDSLRLLFDPDEITRTAARVTGDRLGVSRCAYADVEDDGDTFHFSGDHNWGVPSIVGRYRFSQFGVACLQSMRRGTPYLVTDSECDHRIDPSVRQAYRATQIRSMIGVPVLKGGRLVAAMAVHQVEPRLWTAAETNLLQVVANRCWESIERAHITRELTSNENRLRLAQKAGRIGSFEWLIKENRIIWSPELEALYGLPEGSFEGQFSDWSKRVAPEDAEEVIAGIAEVLNRKGAEYSYEFRAIWPTGELRWLRGQSQFRYDEAGQPELMIGVNIDIHIQKTSEQALLESEARFRQVMDSMPQLVWSTLPNGFHDLYNRQWYEYTGLTFEDTKGNKWNEVFHPDDRLRSRERWDHSLKTGELYEIEYRCRRFDGVYRWFLGRATPLFNHQGEITRWFGTCTDIHDQKENESALRKANRELEEFAYVASHDLQEPLRMVSIYTQLLLKAPGIDPARQAEYAAFIRQGVARMQALISDLLTFSRTVHRDDLSIGRADLAASLVEALAVLQPRILESGATVTAAALPETRGDTAQMTHVFENLLSNALKYRKREIDPVITIECHHDADACIVSVRDNGIGFEQAYAERIFGLFKRLHKDEYPGNGLGLAICQRIVERYGGQIWAESQPGAGATFFFRLPLQ